MLLRMLTRDSVPLTCLPIKVSLVIFSGNIFSCSVFLELRAVKS